MEVGVGGVADGEGFGCGGRHAREAFSVVFMITMS